MRDFPFSFNSLHDYSRSNPYTNFDDSFHQFFKSLNVLRLKYNFPSVHDDVGSLLSFLASMTDSRTIFEFGSGYGQSAFWFLYKTNVEKIYLTEKRDDLVDEFNNLDWPNQWFDKIDYYQGDAFERFNQLDVLFDIILIDGVKSTYIDFLKICHSKLKKGSLVIIDNSYWRGSFLDPEMVTKKQTSRKIKELHDYISSSDDFKSIFLPFIDGVSVLLKV